MLRSVLLYISIELIVFCFVTVSGICPEPAFLSCNCGFIDYSTPNGKEKQYVVNCTDLNINNVSILQHLPQHTQVLIFVGNQLPSLPWNLFGTNSNNSMLKVIDLSNNGIREILGKSFHRVPNVERLLLNHNNISISSSEHHPRIFSNFQSLTELHLTNAFADNTPDGLASDLHDIFINSNLTKLKKLHLEQNEISKFNDSRVFCDLTSLMDLYLGDNKLENLSFKIDCLQHLRFIDLEYNMIRELSENDLRKLDFLPKRRQPLTIDLSGNSLVCGNSTQRFYDWLINTKVVVRNKNRLKCLGTNNPVVGTCTKTQVQFNQQSSSATVLVLSVLLFLCVCLLFYTNREFIFARSRPALLALSRKVHYSNIGHQDVQEMEV